MMARSTRLLVPIRYPITDSSAQTLDRAKQIAAEMSENGDVEIIILHVNLIHVYDNTRVRQIRRAAKPILGQVPFSVITRRGFLIEETILDEAKSTNSDVIIVGANQAPRWRRVLYRLLPTQPNIVGYLQQNIGPDVSVEVV